MKFVDLQKLNVNYESYPFPHTIIDNFLNEDILKKTLSSINSLKTKDAPQAYLGKKNESKKFAFNKKYGAFLGELFKELNSIEFIKAIEKLTGIDNIIKENTTLRGAGIHIIENKGYLQLHTDFNSYVDKGVKLDRRINLLIYMNPEWKPEYNGDLCLCDKEKNVCVKKIMPILNRCVIFNTTNKSVHGHPTPLKVPSKIRRQSIAVYYYTKNTNNKTDFEGDPPHSTLWYPNIKI